MRRIVSAILTLSLALSFVLAQGESAFAAVPGYDSAYAGESVFTNKAAGESGQFSVIFTNTGTQGWFRNIVGLIACKDDKTTCNVAPEEAAYAKNWFSSTVYATVSADTSGGQNAFFIYDFTVPAGTAGSTAAVFNGDVGIISTGALIRPEGYFQINTTPAAPVGLPLALSPTSANVANGAQQQFTASNVPTGATAAWSVTGGCGAVTQTGLFVATAVNSATQPCSVVVSAGGQTASATISVYGPASSIACSVDPASVVANGINTVAVSGTLKDANSNTVANATTAVTFNNNTTTIATPTAAETKAAVAGVASKTYTSTTTTGTAQISLSSGTLTGCQATFTTTSIGSANKLAASFSPTTIGADGVSASRLRVDVQDSAGNRRVSDTTTAVTVTRDPASASFCSPASSGPSTVAAGRFDFTITSTATPGTCTYTATATSLTSATATLTTAVVGVPNKLVVSSNDSPKPAGTGTDNTITVVLELQDANGLRVTSPAGQSVGILSDVPSSCTGTADSTVSTGTSATGAGRSTFTYATATAQTCTVTYSVPTNTLVTTITASVTWTSGAATNLTCLFTPLAAGSTIAGAIINDGSSTATGTVTIRDALANKVSDGAYSITFSRATGTSTTLLTSNPQTTSGGTTTFTVRSTTTPGTDTYTAAITSGSSPTLTTPTSPACSISAQTSLP